jgi:hypothetical protein
VVKIWSVAAAPATRSRRRRESGALAPPANPIGDGSGCSRRVASVDAGEEEVDEGQIRGGLAEGEERAARVGREGEERAARGREMIRVWIGTQEEHCGGLGFDWVGLVCVFSEK